MSHWNRRAWNPNGGRYAAQHYPVQQQQQQQTPPPKQKHDVLDDSDDEDDGPFDEGIAATTHQRQKATAINSSSPSRPSTVRSEDSGTPSTGTGYASSRREKAPLPVSRTSSRRAAALASTNRLPSVGDVAPSSNSGNTATTTRTCAPTNAYVGSSIGSSTRLRGIQQRRLETLRASGNHAAAAIFERAVLKASVGDGESVTARAARAAMAGGSYADIPDDGSVLTFATEATDAVSVRPDGQQTPPVQHQLQVVQITTTNTPTSITPTKQDVQDGRGEADTPDTQPVSPSTPDSTALNGSEDNPLPSLPVPLSAEEVDSPMLEQHKVTPKTILDTSYESSVSSTPSVYESRNASSFLSTQEDTDLSVLLSSQVANHDKDGIFCPPPLPPPPPPPAILVKDTSRSSPSSPALSQASTKTSTTATTSSPTQRNGSTNTAATSAIAGFVAINAAAAEREERAKRIAQAEAEAKRMEQESNRLRIAQEQAVAAARLAESKRVAEEKAAAAAAEAEENARRIAEERAAEEKARRDAEERAAAAAAAATAAAAAVAAEQERKAREKALAEARRVADERAAAERARLAAEEENRRIAQERALEEAKRIAEEAALRESTRIAQEQQRRREEERIEAERIAAEQAAAAEAEAEAKRIAEEAALRESTRIAQEQQRRREEERIEAERIAAVEQAAAVAATAAAAERGRRISEAKAGSKRLQQEKGSSDNDTVESSLEDILDYSNSEGADADDEASSHPSSPSSSFLDISAETPASEVTKTPPGDADATPTNLATKRWGQSARKSSGGSKGWGRFVLFSSSGKSKPAVPMSPLKDDDDVVSNLSDRINEAAASPQPPLPPKKDGADSFDNEYQRVIDTLPRPEHYPRMHHRIDSEASAALSHNSMASSATPVTGIATRDVSNQWDRPDTPPASDVNENEYYPHQDGLDLESAALGVGLAGLIGHPTPEMAASADLGGSHRSFESSLKAARNYDFDRDTSSSVDMAVEVGSMGGVNASRISVGQAKQDSSMDYEDPTSFADRPSSSKRSQRVKIVPAHYLSRCRSGCFSSMSCPKMKPVYWLLLAIPVIAVMLYLCYFFFVQPAISG